MKPASDSRQRQKWTEASTSQGLDTRACQPLTQVCAAPPPLLRVSRRPLQHQKGLLLLDQHALGGYCHECDCLMTACLGELLHVIVLRLNDSVIKPCRVVFQWLPVARRSVTVDFY
jgi:hypothetical protein